MLRSDWLISPQEEPSIKRIEELTGPTTDCSIAVLPGHEILQSLHAM